MSGCRRVAYGFLAVLLCGVMHAVGQEPAADHVPKPGEFPPPGTGHVYAGELVMVDPINRRGGLRLDGDKSGSSADRYDKGDPLRFSMLPYGMIWYHGAPAELRDVPIGTHLHGTFYLPPDGDKSIPFPKGPPHYVPKHNHAILLEDDFSYYQRKGLAWKVASIDLQAEKLQVVLTGDAANKALSGPQTFLIDPSTRVWKGRESATLEDIAADQLVQVGLSWAPNWEHRQFSCSDIWIDAQCRELAAEKQRQIHLRYQRNHWLAGWVDHVEHEPGGGGIVTFTLFGGMDPSLYEEVKSKAKTHGFLIAVAERTLRTYLHSADNRGGPVLDMKNIESPPLGSSGIQLRVRVNELLEGFRPGRVIRARPSGWPGPKLPPEERANLWEE